MRDTIWLWFVRSLMLLCSLLLLPLHLVRCLKKRHMLPKK